MYPARLNRCIASSVMATSLFRLKNFPNVKNSTQRAKTLYSKLLNYLLAGIKFQLSLRTRKSLNPHMIGVY